MRIHAWICGLALYCLSIDQFSIVPIELDRAVCIFPLRLRKVPEFWGYCATNGDKENLFLCFKCLKLR